MSTKPIEGENLEDKILETFNQTKGEQLDMFDEEPKVPKVVKQESKPKEKPKPKPEPKPEPKAKVEPAQEPEFGPEVKMHIGHDGIHYTEDEWLSSVVANGPTRREVEGWKERHEYVYFTPFANEVYVWRTLMRPEYREIIRDTTLTAMDREEMFTEKCTLYPYDFSLDKIKKSRAGVASLLSEMIMDKSGFVAQSAPIRL